MRRVFPFYSIDFVKRSTNKKSAISVRDGGIDLTVNLWEGLVDRALIKVTILIGNNGATPRVPLSVGGEISSYIAGTFESGSLIAFTGPLNPPCLTSRSSARASGMSATVMIR